MSSKHLPAETRREVTVEAVVALAAERNPSDITTAAIASHMKLTQGALFRHFPTKDAIWEAVMDWVADRLLARVDHAASAGASPIAALQAIFEAHPGEISALILEPLVQCAGGMRMHDPAYLRRARELCDANGAFLIADEIATGFGRTGTLFACEQAGISPDLMCLSKGLTGGFLPLAAVLATQSLYDGFLDDSRERAFLHSHSYTGNPLACAAAMASLDIFESDGVLERNRATAAAMAAIRSAQSRKSRSPSGMTSSWAALRWICRASASIISTARTACSGASVGPTLASTKARGASRRMTRKPSARSGSLRAMCWEPQAIATPASAAAPSSSIPRAPSCTPLPGMTLLPPHAKPPWTPGTR